MLNAHGCLCMYPLSLMYGMFGSFYDLCTVHCAYVLYLCFPVGHKKPSVGSGDKHFYYGDFLLH